MRPAQPRAVTHAKHAHAHATPLSQRAGPAKPQPRPQSLGRPRDLEGSGISVRYEVDGAVAKPTGCISYRATRRFDARRVWIIVPQHPAAQDFPSAKEFVRAARDASRLSHPSVLRTIESGLLADGRPFAVVERLMTESLANWITDRGRLSWSQRRTVALRLCGAVEAARRLGLAPRNLDGMSCSHVRHGTDECDVRLGELFVEASSRPAHTDAPAIAMIVHELEGLGGDDREDPLGNLLLRAMGSNGFPDVRAFSRALAAVGSHGRTHESNSANHASVAGEFIIDEADEAPESQPARSWAGERSLPWLG